MNPAFKLIILLCHSYTSGWSILIQPLAMSPTPTRRRHPKDETVDFLSERSQALLENGHGRTSLTPSRTLSLNLEQELGAHQPSADEESPT